MQLRDQRAISFAQNHLYASLALCLAVCYIALKLGKVWVSSLQGKMRTDKFHIQGDI